MRFCSVWTSSGPASSPPSRRCHALDSCFILVAYLRESGDSAVDCWDEGPAAPCSGLCAGFPWWPAIVTHASRAQALGWTRPMGSTCCLLQYFGPKIEVGSTARKGLLPFPAGLARGFHQEPKKKYKMEFGTGMAQVQRCEHSDGST